jgi:transcriptional regulator with XRE-family HTH domain
MLGIKQEALAFDLGDFWNRKKISMLEQKEIIEPELLQQIADVLKVPADAIKNFDEDVAVSYINTFNDNSDSHVIGNYGTYNFNPIEKWIEAIEDNKRLYEALLKSDREKIALLEKMLADEKKK